MAVHHDAVVRAFQIALYLGLVQRIFAAVVIDNENPATCISKSDASQHYFFDIAQLQCLPCAQTAEFQVVSQDGLRCVCKAGYYLLKDYGGKEIQCAPCGAGKETSEDGWGCVDCVLDPSGQNCLASCTGQNVISVERLINGSWKNNIQKKSCDICGTNTMPNAERNRCLRCNQILSMITNRTSCDCPDLQTAGGLCFAEPTDLISAQMDSLYTVKFGDDTLRSAYFKDHLVAAHAICSDKYGNLTACQLLGNLCVLLLYVKDGVTENACTLYNSGQLTARTSQEWPANKPWLYYFKDSPRTLLSDSSLPRQFTFPDDRLRLYATRYSLDGSFLGTLPLEGSTLQLCSNTRSVLEAMMHFGTDYQQSCSVPVADFWDENKYPLIFYDLFIEEVTNGKSQLYPIPVLIDEYESNGNKVNTGSDISVWQFVRRLFLVDNVSGRQASDLADVGQDSQAMSVRYARSITLQVELQSGTSDGRIYVPTLRISYGTASRSDMEAGKKVQVSFSVRYHMDLSGYRRSLSIAVGVLSALSIIHAFLRTWSWSKRAGKIAIDIVSIVKFVLFVCAGLANVFFVVCIGVAVWWLIFYKRQKSVYLLVPNSDEESEFITYLVVALALKAIQMLHMILAQSNVDIFFIDWERSRGGLETGGAAGSGDGPPVSIWRTYFTANEWNEIQTTRKINDILQIFAAVFFLHVVGFERAAGRSPTSEFSPSPGTYLPPDSRIFRFAIASVVYIIIAAVQWMFYTFIYERFLEDRVRQYVDLCSMCNVSVFVLENAHFGYYIHGRSVHGAADTGMRQMHENLRREEEDLCGKRGLQPNTEQQTFMMAIPSKLRTQYDRVLMPISSPQQGAMVAAPGGTKSGHIDPQTASSIHAYTVLNRFLQVFIDHSLRDIDYTIKDRTLLESVLDIEFEDAAEKGIFYNDNSHSFDAVLFFGNETTILIFELLLFATFDLLSGSFVLAGVVTYVAMHVISMVRDSLGKANIVKKTLVDKRFLI